MKRILTLAAVAFVATLVAPAQQQPASSGDRIVVPARNSTRPRLVKVSSTNGSITVKAYAGREVTVESESSRQTRRNAGRAPEGLHRLDFPMGGVEVTEDDNTVTVRGGNNSGNLLVNVPTDTSLQVRSTNGKVTVEGVRGEIDVNSNNADVILTSVSGTVLAYSHNGAVKASMDKVDPGKPISFSSWNGDVDVTLPADFKANVKIKATQGEVYVGDFDLKVSPSQAVTEKSDSKNGPFRIRMDRTITGTIGGGGADATFTTYNGKILIRKK